MSRSALAVACPHCGAQKGEHCNTGAPLRRPLTHPSGSGERIAHGARWMKVPVPAKKALA